jgi:hypothetical protein
MKISAITCKTHRNSILVQIEPFHFLNFCNLILYHLELLFVMKTVRNLIPHLIYFKHRKPLKIHNLKSITPKIMIPVPRILF